MEGKLKDLEAAGVVDRNIESNIPLKDYEITADADNGTFRIDKTVSGQYLITSLELIYENDWKYILTLNRPADITPDIMKSE